jgi:hypothetical protein
MKNLMGVSKNVQSKHYVFHKYLLPLFQSQCNGLYRPVAVSFASTTNMLDLLN